MNAILGAILAAAAAQAADPVELTGKDLVQWINAHSRRRLSASADLGLEHKRLTVPRTALDETRAYEAGTRLLRTLDFAVVQADASGLQEVVHGPIASKRPLAVHVDVASLPPSDEFCSLVLTF